MGNVAEVQRPQMRLFADALLLHPPRDERRRIAGAQSAQGSISEYGVEPLPHTSRRFRYAIAQRKQHVEQVGCRDLADGLLKQCWRETAFERREPLRAMLPVAEVLGDCGVIA